MDQRTLTEIYDRHCRELLVYIRGFVKSPEQAEDLLHDVFVRLIQYSQDHDIDSSRVRALLYRISHNLCVDFLRQNSRSRTTSLDQVTAPDTSPSVESNIDRDELFRNIGELVSTRDHLSRSVFYMRTELEMTYAEIALNLGISERTAKRKMRAILHFLSGELEKTGFSGFNAIFLSLL